MRVVKELSNQNRIVYERTCGMVSKVQKEAAYVIKFVLFGMEKCVVNNRAISIFPDSFTVLNVETDHYSVIDSATPVDSLSLYLDANFVTDLNKTFFLDQEQLLDGVELKSTPHFIETLYPLTVDLKCNINHLKHQLLEGIDNEALFNEYLHHCLWGYYKVSHQEITEKFQGLDFLKAKTKKEVFRRLLLAKEFLNSNSDKEVILEDVANYCCLSVNHLLRTFKSAYGVSPHQYLIQLRLNRAKLLLKTTGYPLSEILCLVGFENASSFVRLFKANVGTTPLKYRKALVQHYFFASYK